MVHTDRESLLQKAKEASTRAYVRYSGFHVGAAGVFQNEDGDIEVFTGCNIENAAYGPTNCAERTAIFTAIAAGYIHLLTMCVYTPTEKATPPCGVCRQVMNEFGPKATIIYGCEGEVKETTLEKLLPEAFGPHNLAT